MEEFLAAIILAATAVDGEAAYAGFLESVAALTGANVVCLMQGSFSPTMTSKGQVKGVVQR